MGDKNYKAVVLLEREISAKTKEEAEQLARKMAYDQFKKDAGNKHWDMAGHMAEEVEDESK